LLFQTTDHWSLFSMMRIVAGTLGGRRLCAPKGAAIRPTSNRVREAIFSIIGTGVSGARVLDLFAGTGALGLEALSRGALHAVFVDQSRHAIRLIRANVELCKVQERVTLIHGSVAHAVRRLAGQGASFDLIFMDPPYGRHSISKTLLNVYQVARSGTLVIAEHHVKDLLPFPLEGWTKRQERRYGDTAVSFLVKELAS
jgi:16S rRNA (guanine966-N2)-methyltransferase